MTTNQALAPQRATASGTLAWGMVVIPVQFFAGVEDQAVTRTEWVVDAEGTYARVGRVPAVKNEDGTYGEVVSYEDIIKRYQTEDGSLVELTDSEMADACDLPSGMADIVCFQPLSLLNAGAYLPESVMQVRAARKGQQAQYALSLMFKAMREQAVFALVRYTMRGALHYGALMANGRFLSLRFDNEIRAALPLPSFDHSQAELTQAVALVQSRIVSDRVELLNDAAERIRDYAEAKAAATADPDGQPAIQAHPVHNPVGTLLETLQASVTAAAAARS